MAILVGLSSVCATTQLLLNHHHRHRLPRHHHYYVQSSSNRSMLAAATPITSVFPPPPPPRFYLSVVYSKPITNAPLRLPSSSSSPLTQAQSLNFVRHAASASPGAQSSLGTESEGTSGNLLDHVQVLDLNGSKVAISDLWKDRKAIVAFARHFGCVLCRKRADYLASHKEKMDAAGVSLVLIGPGSVDQARTFVEQTKFRGDVYADPNHSSYEALRFVSGVSTTFTPRAGLKIVQAYMEGYRQDWGLSFEKETRTRGGWQQGGIIVAGPGKRNISYIHKDKEAGDDPDIEDVLKACCP